MRTTHLRSQWGLQTIRMSEEFWYRINYSFNSFLLRRLPLSRLLLSTPALALPRLIHLREAANESLIQDGFSGCNSSAGCIPREGPNHRRYGCGPDTLSIIPRWRHRFRQSV